MNQKHLEDIQNYQAAEQAMKWYGWGSPIGLIIFFLGGTLTLAILAWIIKFLFFMK